MVLQIVMGGLLLLLLMAGTCQAVTLVEKGQARAAIVVPAGTVLSGDLGRASAGAAGASELQRCIEKATGVLLPVLAEDEIGGRVTGDVVFVGACVKTREVVDVSGIQPEGFVIRTQGNALYIVGRDETDAGREVDGTLYGVCEFLERYVGVRWVMPGEVGEVVPLVDTIEIDGVDIRQEPLLWQRKVRNSEIHAHRDRVRVILKDWGVSVPEWEAFFADSVSAPWFRRQRIGSRVRVIYGHAYQGWWNKYHEAHPNIFALQPDGTRINTNERERLCVSNPTLWDLVAQEKIEELTTDPQLTAASISPNDGGRNAFCSCDDCRVWDSDEAKKMLDDDPDSIRPGSRLPLTDRYFRFYNEVGKRVKEVLPDRFLGVYAYSLYKTPPVKVDHLEDNLLVGYVGFSNYLNDEAWKSDREYWLAWGKLAQQLFVRPNLLWAPVGLPVNYVHRLASDLRFMADHGLRASDYDGLIGNWGTQGLLYYVLPKLLWNPYADVDEVVDDYCRAAYGKGADAMKTYYSHLEALTDQIAREGKFLSQRGRDWDVLMDYYTDEVIDGLQAEVDRALDVIGETDSNARVRVEMVATGLAYTRQARRLVLAARDVRMGRRSKASFAQIEVEVIGYYTSLTMNWSVSIAHNYSYLRRSLSLRRK